MQQAGKIRNLFCPVLNSRDHFRGLIKFVEKDFLVDFLNIFVTLIADQSCQLSVLSAVFFSTVWYASLVHTPCLADNQQHICIRELSMKISMPVKRTFQLGVGVAIVHVEKNWG